MSEKEISGDRPTKRINYATYPQDYYAGSQVRVYFGGIWVDDIATIQYQTSHSKTPLYGYNDHQFRAIAKGQFIVKGSFTIAFKETGYMRSIIDMIKHDNKGLSKVLQSGDRNKNERFMFYLNNGFTPEQALGKAAEEGLSSTYFGGNTKNSDFEDVAEVLEDSIWGKEYSKYKKRIPRSDELDYFKYTGKKGFKEDIDLNGFDILITFGNYNKGYENAEHTMIAINDVHIVGESLIATPGDEPIGMNIEFFARGLNERVSTQWPEKDQDATEKNTEQNPDEALTSQAPGLITPQNIKIDIDQAKRGTETYNLPANAFITIDSENVSDYPKVQANLIAGGNSPESRDWFNVDYIQKLFNYSPLINKLLDRIKNSINEELPDEGTPTVIKGQIIVQFDKIQDNLKRNFIASKKTEDKYGKEYTIIIPKEE